MQQLLVFVFTATEYYSYCDGLETRPKRSKNKYFYFYFYSTLPIPMDITILEVIFITYNIIGECRLQYYVSSYR